jgi:hypothetical protein
MSDASGLPRLLASLLGVEAPVRRAQPAPPPDGARPRIPASAVDDVRARSVRRPPVEGEARAAAPPVRTAPVEGRLPRVGRARGDSAVGVDVRRVLRRSDSLRSAVVVAEVLGAPRSLRPYGADGDR